MNITHQFIQDISVPTNTVTVFYLQFTTTGNWDSGSDKFAITSDLLALNVIACKIPAGFSPSITDNINSYLLLGYSLDGGSTVKLATRFTKEELASNHLSSASDTNIYFDLRKFEVNCKFDFLNQEGVISRHYHTNGNGTFLNQNKISELISDRSPDYRDLKSHYQSRGGVIPDSEFANVGEVLTPKHNVFTASNNDPSELYTLKGSTLWFLGQDCSTSSPTSDDKWALIKLDQNNLPDEFRYLLELSHQVTEFAVPHLWNGDETPIGKVTNSSLNIKVTSTGTFTYIRGENPSGQFTLMDVEGNCYLYGDIKDSDDRILVFRPVVGTDSTSYIFAGPCTICQILSDGEVTTSATTDTAAAFISNRQIANSESKFNMIADAIVYDNNLDAQLATLSTSEKKISSLIQMKFLGMSGQNGIEPLNGALFTDVAASAVGFASTTVKYHDTNVNWAQFGGVKEVYNSSGALFTASFTPNTFGTGQVIFTSLIGKGPITAQFTVGGQVIKAYSCVNQKMILTRGTVSSSSLNDVTCQRVSLLGDESDYIQFTVLAPASIGYYRWTYDFSNKYIEIKRVGSTNTTVFAFISQMTVENRYWTPKSGETEGAYGALITFTLAQSTDTTLVPNGTYETCTYALSETSSTTDERVPALCSKSGDANWQAEIEDKQLTTPADYHFIVDSSLLIPSSVTYAQDLAYCARYQYLGGSQSGYKNYISLKLRS